ncbi:unnamed protein product [Cunninghamella echinulata]
MLLTKINQFPSIEFDSKNYKNDSDISTLHDIETNNNDDDSFKIIPSFQSFPQQEKNQRHSILSSSSSSIHTSYSSATTTRTLRNSLSQFTNTSTYSSKHLSLPHHPPLPFQNTTSPLPSYSPHSFQKKEKNYELLSYYYHDILSKTDDTNSALSSSSSDQNNNNNNSNHLSQWWGDKKRKWKQFRYKKCNNKKNNNNNY